MDGLNMGKRVPGTFAILKNILLTRKLFGVLT